MVQRGLAVSGHKAYPRYPRALGVSWHHCGSATFHRLEWNFGSLLLSGVSSCVRRAVGALCLGAGVEAGIERLWEEGETVWHIYSLHNHPVRPDLRVWVEGMRPQKQPEYEVFY